MKGLDGDPGQRRLLQETLRRAGEQGTLMQRAIEDGNTEGAIERAADMLKELKTSSLAPRTYYELYMKVREELLFLEEYIYGLHSQGVPIVKLYEQVQGQSAVLPRLYLLVTVGGSYIRSGEAPAADILKDLVEMVKGVQQPLRGLFLRNYLGHVTRDKLPDAADPSTLGGGSAVDTSIEFVLENFVEANRLWVRMHHQAGAKDKKKRERERKEMRLLVGTNLVRLSQLEGIDVHKYRAAVLPRVLQQVVACKDTIAQSYLLDCTIQVFPDDFHLQTLGLFLDSLSQLKDKVKICPILESLMERLGNFATSNPDSQLPAEVGAFSTLSKGITAVVQQRPSLELGEIVSVLVALAKLVQACFPKNSDYLDECLRMCVQAMSAKGAGMTAMPASVSEACRDLLSVPLQMLSLGALELPSYSTLARCLPWPDQKTVAVQILREVMSKDEPVASAAKVEQLLAVVSPLVREPPPGSGAKAAEANLGEEPLLVARLVHMMWNSDTDEWFRILLLARLHLGQARSTVADVVLVPLVFAALKLVAKLAPPLRKGPEEPVEEQVQLEVVEVEGEGEGPVLPEQPESGKSVPAEAAAEEATGGDGDGEPEGTNLNAEKAEAEAEAGVEAEAVEGGNAVLVAEASDAVVAKGEEEGTGGAGDTSGSSSADKPKPDEGEQEGDGQAAAALSPAQFSARKVLQFLHELVTAMAPGHPWVSLRLFLQCAAAADSACFPAITHEFVSQAFILYEDELLGTRVQARALTAIIGALSSCVHLDTEDYDALTTKAAQHAAKFPTKLEQCRLVMLCSHLFWVSGPDGQGHHDGRRVLECLQRALKIADGMLESVHVMLFVEILNHYLYYYVEGNPAISAKYIEGLIALIKEHMAGIESPELQHQVEAYFQNTIKAWKN
ncbi:unnamed protein product [Chrysoparadoxa australica]